MPLPLLPLPLPLLLLPLAQAEVRITTEDVSTWAVVEPFSFGRLRVLKYMSTTKPTPLLLLLLLLRLLATAARRIEVLPDTWATPICTTVVQIKRARLENASRTTHPETHL